MVQQTLPVHDRSIRRVLDELPDWFRDLGTERGISRLEITLNHTVPAALRLFYAFPATGCRLMLHCDTDIVLEGYPPPERPAVVTWYYRPHLVLAEFPHSQT